MQEPVNLLIADDERGPMESLRMIGGDLRLRSEPGKGTIVVTLPGQPALNGSPH